MNYRDRVKIDCHVVKNRKNLPKPELGKEYFRVFTQSPELGKEYFRVFTQSPELGKEYFRVSHSLRSVVSKGKYFGSGLCGVFH